MEGVYAGGHRSKGLGASPEFVEYREYAPGDEVRSIDWRVFARTDEHHVRLFERETDLGCQVFLDVSASMAFPDRWGKTLLPNSGPTKFRYASALAAAILFLLVRQGDRVGLTLFDSGVRAHLPPGGTFAWLYRALARIEHERPQGETSVARALRDAMGLMKRRGLVIVVSDFHDDPAEVFRALDLYRHRKFDVLLFHVLHACERRLPDLPGISFVDAETGERLSVRTVDVREEYARRVDEFLEALAAGCRCRNVGYRFAPTDRAPSLVLREYLLGRRRRP